jgi:hypothetical protein
VPDFFPMNDETRKHAGEPFPHGHWAPATED